MAIKRLTITVEYDDRYGTPFTDKLDMAMNIDQDPFALSFSERTEYVDQQEVTRLLGDPKAAKHIQDLLDNLGCGWTSFDELAADAASGEVEYESPAWYLYRDLYEALRRCETPEEVLKITKDDLFFSADMFEDADEHICDNCRAKAEAEAGGQVKMVRLDELTPSMLRNLENDHQEAEAGAL